MVIFSVTKTGCPWRLMPTHIGHAHTIYGSFRRWRQAGVWGCIMDTRRQWERQSQGRLPEPSACGADSQRVKTATQGEDVGEIVSSDSEIIVAHRSRSVQ